MSTSNAASDVRTRNVLRYLRDCYRADNRGVPVFDLFADSVSHTHAFEGVERLVSGELPQIPGPADKLLPAGAASAVYRRERTLVYGAFVIAGRTGERGGLPKRICAPLLTFPASVIESETADDTIAYVSADLTRADYNVPLLRALLDGPDDDTQLLEDLLSALPESPLTRDAVWTLKETLDEFVEGVDSTTMFTQTEFEPEQRLRKARGSALRCLPAGVLALVPNAQTVRGVVFDLDAMANTSRWSAPVRTLLDGAPPTPQDADGSELPPEFGRVPAVLSHAQQGAVESARVHPVTLVIGPPGTGKSYTMAASALDQVSRGASVLIASRTRQALDVVERKIEELIGAEDFMIRGGRGQQLRMLSTRLDQLLMGAMPAPEKPKEVERLRSQIARHESDRRELEERIARIADLEIARSVHAQPNEGAGLFARFGAGLKLQLAEWRLSRAGVPWELLDDYETVLEERSKAVARLLRNVVLERVLQARGSHFGELRAFRQALTSRTSSTKEKRFRELDLGILLQAFPLWLSTFSDAHRVLPVKRELFDLVLVDEATQCDMASCVPVVQRGKRLLVTGDPKQLRHVSFLARSTQTRLADTHDLDERQRAAFDYRGRSLLDRVSAAVTDPSQAVFLNEHFRGTPDLIAFSNAEFYGDDLAVMTERPETADLTSIEVHVTSGRREDEGHNPGEADAVLTSIAELIASESDLPRKLASSIGVLSPFRAHADHLQEHLSNRLSYHDIDRHDVLVGTAHSFQGEERDVMFVSLAVDEDVHPQALRFLTKPDVFNVAVTRAKRFQHVFLSRALDSLPGGSLVRRYLDRATADRRARAEGETRDAALAEVAAALASDGRRIFTEYAVAGTVVDVIVEQDDASLGIDLIGFPGPFGVAFDLERYRMFRRAGFHVLPLPWSRWQEDPDGCLVEITRRLSGEPSR